MVEYVTVFCLKSTNSLILSKKIAALGQLLGIQWGGRWGSNPRQPESQSGTLPTELLPPLQMNNILEQRILQSHSGNGKDFFFQQRGYLSERFGSDGLDTFLRQIFRYPGLSEDETALFWLDERCYVSFKQYLGGQVFSGRFFNQFDLSQCRFFPKDNYPSSV